jgi:co-chaperonin GroES (HSP10)
MKIDAIGDNVVCLVKKKDSVSEGGIFLSEGAIEEYLVVASIGPDVSTIKLNDEVICPPDKGGVATYGGYTFKVAKESEFVGIIRK